MSDNNIGPMLDGPRSTFDQTKVITIVLGIIVLLLVVFIVKHMQTMKKDEAEHDAQYHQDDPTVDAQVTTLMNDAGLAQ